MPDLYPVTGDALSEAELSNWLNQSNLANYVESGSYTVNHTNEEVTADASVAYIRDTGGDLYKVEPDQKTLALPDQSGTNYLYITFDPTASDPDASPDWEISSTQGGPADPKLLRATIDASADTDTSNNDNPSVGIEKLTSNVDADGNDVTGVGSLGADEASIGQVVGRATLTSNQTISTGTVTQVNLDSQENEDSDIVTVDLSNNKITITTDGRYLVRASVSWAGSANWTDGDRFQAAVRDDTNDNSRDIDEGAHHGNNQATTQKAGAIFDVSGDTDAIIRVYHERGGDETIEGDAIRTWLEVVRIG